MLPTKQNTTTGLDYCLCFDLFFFFFFFFLGTPSSWVHLCLLESSNELRTLVAILLETGILHAYLGLGQWLSLQNLVSRCPGRFIYTELNHFSHYHHDLLCQSFRKSAHNCESACCWVHLCLHNTCNLHWHSCVYHIFQQLRHTKLWKKVPKLNLEFNRRNIVEVANVPADNFAAKEDFSRLRESLLEDLSQPNYGAF